MLKMMSILLALHAERLQSFTLQIINSVSFILWFAQALVVLSDFYISKGRGEKVTTVLKVDSEI